MKTPEAIAPPRTARNRDPSSAIPSPLPDAIGIVGCASTRICRGTTYQDRLSTQAHSPGQARRIHRPSRREARANEADPNVSRSIKQEPQPVRQRVFTSGYPRSHRLLTYRRRSESKGHLSQSGAKIKLTRLLPQRGHIMRSRKPASGSPTLQRPVRRGAHPDSHKFLTA
jgi:hypothetical protein